jgi:uncharacterized protein YgiM (DUF1202 family)
VVTACDLEFSPVRKFIALLLTAAFVILAMPTEDADARRGRRSGYSHSTKSYHVKTRKKYRRAGKRNYYGRRRSGSGTAAKLVALGAVGIAALGAGATVAAIAGGLNVRSGPSTRERIVDTLAYGEEVTIQGVQGEWAEVQTADGRTGYAHANYLGRADEEDDEED